MTNDSAKIQYFIIKTKFRNDFLNSEKTPDSLNRFWDYQEDVRCLMNSVSALTYHSKECRRSESTIVK